MRSAQGRGATLGARFRDLFRGQVKFFACMGHYYGLVLGV